MMYENLEFGYEDAVEYLKTTYKINAGQGMINTKNNLSRLSNPQDCLQVIHVAGTNGKGSVCAMLASILQESAYNVGLFTSPHLVRVNERIVINGVPISDGDFLASFLCCVQPGMSFYEIITCMAFHYFEKQHVDIVIIETGVGGELDPTNVIDKPILSIITSIGFDHMELLGDSLEAIASEKAGIIKSGRPVALGYTANIPVIKQKAALKASPVYYINDETDIFNKTYNLKETVYSVKNKFFAYSGLHMPLLGEYQTFNGALVLMAAHILNALGYEIKEDAVREGLKKVKWPGRFDIYRTKHENTPLTVFDGAHNEESALAFYNSLKIYFADKEIVLVIGTLKNKKSDIIINILAKAAHTIICTQPPHPSALPAVELAGLVKKNGVDVKVNKDFVGAYIEAERQTGPQGVVAVAGSLYLVGGLYDKLQR